MKNLEIQYNKLLQRWKDCEKFYESDEHSMEEKERWIPHVKELSNKLSELIIELRKHGYEMNEKQVFEGFEEEKQ